jgi:hypothetical protein
MRIIAGAVLLMLGISVAPAQEFEQRVTDFIAAAEIAAKGLDGAEDRILKLFAEAKDQAGAEEQLRSLEAKMREAAETYGPQSTLWADHAALAAFVAERRENAAQNLQSTGDTRWQKQVERWENNAAALQELRLSIISEADRAAALHKTFSGEITLVLDIRLAEGVEAAIKELEGVRQNLKAMNDNVEGALQVAKAEMLAPETGN